MGRLSRYHAPGDDIAITESAGLANPLHGRFALQVFGFTVAAAVMLVSVIAPTMTPDVPAQASAEAEQNSSASADVAQSLSLHAAASLQPMGRDSYEAKKYVPPVRQAPAAGAPDPGSAKAIAYDMVLARGWDSAQYDCLVALWQKESGWNHFAHNTSSGAYGIPQSLPGNKMATAGADWATNPATQITWGLGYIQGRYATPCGAYQHSQLKNWY